MVTLNVPGIPIPQGSKNIFNGRLVETNANKLRIWRKAIGVAATNHHQGEPIDRPVHMTVEFRFPRPKHHFGTGKNALVIKEKAPTQYTAKPDLDKLIRAVGDALTQAGIIRDDSRITRITATKVYGVPGATITLNNDESTESSLQT